MGLSKCWHLWRRKRAQMKRRREMIAQTEARLAAGAAVVMLESPAPTEPSRDDLAAWLTQIWEEDEARLSHMTFCGGPWPTTDQLLARIAVDVLILRMHTGDHRCPHATSTVLDWRPDLTIDGVRYGLDCPTARLLAVPYADRPGYREEWRP